MEKHKGVRICNVDLTRTEGLGGRMSQWREVGCLDRIRDDFLGVSGV